ncbi:MAG: LicD family protein [Ruminococcus sp.]|nr:LicD family protein [Ruminococcus sp.]
MQIKNILNDFELDWASMPYADDAQIKKLKNKTILICGQNLARCICYALLYQNESKNLNSNIILCGSDYGFYDKAFDCDSFQYIDYSSLGDLSEVDYIIYTSICNEYINEETEFFKNTVNEINLLANISAKFNAKTILVNDSRIYGNGIQNRVYSESEYAKLEICNSKSIVSQNARVIEALWNCHKKQGNFELVTLRTGIILGAKSGIKTVLDTAFESIANGKKCLINPSRKKYSFISIHDVLNAVVFAMTNLKSENAYNICGDNSTVSMAAVAAIFNGIYGSKIDIAWGNYEEIDGCAINTDKIKFQNFEPQINLETALELSVMSYMKSHRTLRLSNSHQGRLTAIQSVQLASLLEIDRICKKHNIKYFLGGGTLLGAVRHKGFIPWDDDSDLMMLREDYDKFCNIAPLELPNGMSFQDSNTDKHCYYEFAKCRIDNTIFATGFAKTHTGMHNGLAIDVFCHDKTANSKLGQKLHIAMTLFTRALVFNKWNNRKAENGSKLQSVITDFCKRLFPIRFSMWIEKKTLKFFKRKKNAKYLYDGMGRNIYNGVFPAKLLDEVIYADFEGYKLPIPKRYDEYLTFLYGDYMQLAPLSTRLGCHIIEQCDIGEYSNFDVIKDN